MSLPRYGINVNCGTLQELQHKLDLLKAEQPANHDELWTIGMDFNR